MPIHELQDKMQTLSIIDNAPPMVGPTPAKDIKQFQNLKAVIKVFKDYDELLQAPGSRTQIELRFNVVKSAFNNYIEESAQREQDANNDDGELNSVIEERYQLINQYGELKDSMEALTIEKATERVSWNRQTENRSDFIKLPPITLPTFDGSNDEWKSFQTAFSRVVAENNAYNHWEKFLLLKAQLRGTAKKLIDGLEASANSFLEAWTLLTDRYDHPRLNHNNQVYTLLDLVPITRENHKDLRTLLDKVTASIQALKWNLQPEGEWNGFLICMLLRKLPQRIQLDWEMSLSDKSIPRYETFERFLNNRCNALRATATSDAVNTKRIKSHVAIAEEVTAEEIPPQLTPRCHICSAGHFVNKCPKYTEQTIKQRCELIKKFNLCYNCLSSRHAKEQCTSKYRCSICKRKHHRSIHEPRAQGKQTISTIAQNDVPTEPLLTTAQVSLRSNAGYITCRALLDSGSQANYITTRLAKRLNLTYGKVDCVITGIANQPSQVTKTLKTSVTSLCSPFSEDIECLILKDITGVLPGHTIRNNEIYIPKHIKLADQEWNKSNPVDLLLGAEVFWKILKSSCIILNENIKLHETQLGWIVTGTIPTQTGNTPEHHFSGVNLNEQVQSLWQLDEVPARPHRSPEETKCEEHFLENVTKLESGKFCVSLPFKMNPAILGASVSIAEKRFQYLERKLDKNPKLREEYSRVINEYHTLGHMDECQPPSPNQLHCYLPHHAVMKESSLTTKCRVVFDASAKTSTNKSLNDILMIGPTTV
ncbi:uncharacterized protein LOC143918624 [Arctopsyche grandis]|uniref:uncharacterized protein LOC143918624 n=1 Tax=Arctopsyche grandis TaxID=121162 RepID=UPI00406D8B5C